MTEQNLSEKLKTIVIGKSRDLADQGVFHKLSLIAFFAWVGLGADGLSSASGANALFSLLHNYAVFSLQRRFYQQGLPLLILPIRV